MSAPNLATRARTRSKRSHDRAGLVLIGVVHGVKSAALLAVACGLFALASTDVPAVAERIVVWANLDRDSAVVRQLLEKATGLTPGLLQAMGGGAIAGAILYGVECYGLLRARVWAEWLTIVATSSFIPFEVVEVIRRTDLTRAAALVLNVGIVAYLVVRRVRRSASQTLTASPFRIPSEGSSST
jgi:uncharacterized membrane protein (DUF2068 family)